MTSKMPPDNDAAYERRQCHFLSPPLIAKVAYLEWGFRWSRRHFAARPKIHAFTPSTPRAITRRRQQRAMPPLFATF